jgi:hypothetical protein
MTRVNIAIASPTDVAAERNAIPMIFNRWNDANGDAFLHAVMWESASVPTLGDHPQHILDKQIIEKSELLIAILWSRLGTPTPTAGSGTVEEIHEFIKHKGAARVMLYFCRRDLPYGTDPAEFARLLEFKEQMRSQGLFREFTTCEEFERELYRHLDVKVREFLNGQLPPPSSLDGQTRRVKKADAHQQPSPRPHELIDFGTTLEDIANGFSARMEAFARIDSAGGDKYLNMGACVYLSCAECLDRFLAYSAAGIRDQDRRVIERMSGRLKRLAARPSDYLPPKFDQFWDEGHEIAEGLVGHAAYLRQARGC